MLTISQLQKKYSSVEIDIFLSHVLGKTKEFLYLAPERKLSGNQVIRLKGLVDRRLKGEPAAYVLGYKDFMGFRFKVNRHTLIPRPETEEMVERVASEQWLVSSGKPIKILDVGTGSGCIAISLARGLRASPFAKAPNFAEASSDESADKKGLGLRPKIFASDISAEALKVAKENAKKHKASVQFVLSDLLKNVKGNFDVIIANLPYGWKEWKNNTSSETVGLKFEPKEALFTTEKGLFEIRRLLEQIANLKHQPKFIYLEFDPRQKVELSKLIKKTLPLYKAEFFKDLNNFWRFVEIKKQGQSFGPA